MRSTRPLASLAAALACLAGLCAASPRFVRPALLPGATALESQPVATGAPGPFSNGTTAVAGTSGMSAESPAAEQSTESFVTFTLVASTSTPAPAPETLITPAPAPPASSSGSEAGECTPAKICVDYYTCSKRLGQ